MESENKLAGARVLVMAGDGADIGIEGDVALALKGIGCRSVEVCSSASAVLEKVSDLSQRPNVALVDLASGGEGFDVCEIAGQLSGGFGVPVLFTMARADVGRMNQAIAAHPVGYLKKPISVDALSEAIATALPEPPPAAATPGPPPALMQPVDEKPATVAAAPPQPPGSLPPLPKPDAEAEVEKPPVPEAEPDIEPDPEPVSAQPPPPAPEPAAETETELEDQSSEVHVQPRLQPPVPPPTSSPEEKAEAMEPIAADSDQQQRTTRGDQLQGLGFLGRGFAHEFNNLLTVLIGNLSLAQDRYEGGAGSPGNEDSELTTSLAAAERARRMVQQLLTFAEGGQPVRDSVRIADLARGILGAHREAHPSIHFQFQCSEPDLKVSVDYDQIARLLENLVANAIQAMPDGGTLIVRLFTATDAQIERVRPGAGQSGLEYLLIEVIDTGVGMDEHTLNRAFDPYFTTRGDVNATGIGLTVCESIAKAHGGFLVLQSKSNRGTIATFHLPMNAATARPDIFQMRDDAGSAGGDEEGIPGLFSPAPQPSDDELPGARSADVSAGGHDSDPDFEDDGEGAGRRVLVMEDDAMIRRLVARCLGRAGYDVVETTNGQAALDVHASARTEGRAFDLILSDLTIEDGMGGIEMMRELRRRDPSVRAIVSSGYADSPAMARPADYGFDAVLPKPYPPRELLRVVSESLSGGEVGG